MNALTAPNPLSLSNQLSLSNKLSVTNIGAGFVLDQLSVTPAVAYSLRQLTASYAGKAINVRRSSDNTAMDIGFVNGALDTTTLLSFCGSGNGFVAKWYNQGSLGSGGDAAQATQGTQPQIVASGAVETFNGQPAVYFAGSKYLVSPAVQLFNTSSSALSAIGVAALPGNSLSICGQGNGFTLRTSTSGDWLAVLYNNAAGSTTATSTNTTANLIGGTFNGSAISLYANGALAASATLSGTPLTTFSQAYCIGANSSGGTNSAVGTISENIVFSSALGTADKQTYDLNAASFYGISGVTS